MKKGVFTLLLFLLALPGALIADPSVSRGEGDSVVISWSSHEGVEYALMASSDLQTWEQVGERWTGTGEVLTSAQPIGETATRFFRVEEYGAPGLKLERLGFGTEGNKWVYQVHSEGGLAGPEDYVLETEIVQRTQYAGKDVVEWSHSRDGLWDHSIYILDDFSEGVFEVGGDDAVEGTTVNMPAAPSLLSTFTAGEPVAVDYDSSTVGPVTGTLTITHEEDPFEVEAGTFSEVIKAVTDYEASLLGFSVVGRITEWYALDVGMLKHIGNFTVAGFGLTSETVLELQSFERVEEGG